MKLRTPEEIDASIARWKAKKAKFEVTMIRYVAQKCTYEIFATDEKEAAKIALVKSVQESDKPELDCTWDNVIRNRAFLTSVKEAETTK